MKVLSTIINPYYSIYASNLNYSITKSKNKKNMVTIFLKDGFINYKIILKKNIPMITCQCNKFTSETLCTHIFYLLYHYYKLPIYIIKLINSWDDYCIDILCSNKNISEKKNQIENNIQQKLEDTECGICLETLNTPIKGDYEIFQCSKCYKLIHSCCLDRWLQKNNTCIYCRHVLKL